MSTPCWIVLLLWAVVGCASAGPPANDPLYRVDIGHSPVRGPDDATVTVVVWCDFECRFCKRVSSDLEALRSEHGSDLRIVWKHRPLASHSHALLAAQAALAAEAQGKFWELDNLMIANHEDLSKDAILGLAKQGGLDVARLQADLDAHTYAGALAADKAAASELEINGTPTFVINGRKVVGALPIEEIRKTIEASIADKQ